MAWLDIFPDGTVFEMEGGTPTAVYDTNGEVAALLAILPKTKAGTFKLAPPDKPQPEITLTSNPTTLSDLPKIISKDDAQFIFGNRIFDNELADLNACLRRFDIISTARLRHFLSQIAHESGGLKWLQEIWGPTEDQIGYEGREDLGNVEPGDGYKFRGAGAIQLTGRYNYQAFCDFIGDSFVMDGCDYVSNAYPFTSAGFWWHNNDMNALCDSGATVAEVTRKVNGGYNGLSDREDCFERACKVIL